MIEDPHHPYSKILQPSMDRAGFSASKIKQATRILTLQLWRNIGPQKMDYPLCFCDARTVARDELTTIHVADYGGIKTGFDTFGVLTSEQAQHKWYVYPEMTPDEVVVFRAYDSDAATQGKPFWTPHASFRDPTQPTGAPQRASIEMRAICLFF